MKAALFLFTLLISFQIYRVDKMQQQRDEEFEQCTDYTDYSCEVCAILLDSTERELISAHEWPEGISVQFVEGKDTFALDALSESEYLTLVKHSK